MILLTSKRLDKEAKIANTFYSALFNDNEQNSVSKSNDLSNGGGKKNCSNKHDDCTLIAVMCFVCHGVV